MTILCSCRPKTAKGTNFNEAALREFVAVQYQIAQSDEPEKNKLWTNYNGASTVITGQRPNCGLCKSFGEACLNQERDAFLARAASQPQVITFVRAIA